MRSAKLRLHYRAYRTAGGFEGRTKDDATDGGGGDSGGILALGAFATRARGNTDPSYPSRAAAILADISPGTLR